MNESIELCISRTNLHPFVHLHIFTRIYELTHTDKHTHAHSYLEQDDNKVAQNNGMAIK